MIYIRKESGKKKDAFCVKNESSIPDFLKKSVRICGEQVFLDCAEGEEICSLGEVIAYEKSDAVKSGWNCWVVGNADTALEVIDGQYFTKPLIIKAEVVSEYFPQFLEGAELSYCKEEHTWSIRTSWGVLKGKIGESYWLLFGQRNGKPDAAILQVSEKSFNDYFVCDEKGNILSSLREVHNKHINKGVS